MERETSPAYEDLGPTRALTCTAEPAPKKRPSAAIQRLISELGLRYRPSAAADLEAHAASIALLARDVADIPPDYLEQAIQKWVRQSHFMPKASELIAIAQGLVTRRHVSLQERADYGNAHLAEIGRSDIRWFVTDGQVALESVVTPEPRGPKLRGLFTLPEIEDMATGRRTRDEILAAKNAAAPTENHYIPEG